MTPSNMISVIVATFFVVFMDARRYFSASSISTRVADDSLPAGHRPPNQFRRFSSLRRRALVERIDKDVRVEEEPTVHPRRRSFRRNRPGRGLLSPGALPSTPGRWEATGPRGWRPPPRETRPRGIQDNRMQAEGAGDGDSRFQSECAWR